MLAALLAFALGSAAPISGNRPAAQALTAAQPLDHLPALRGDYFPMHSAATGRSYHIYVRYPEGYASKPLQRYPVVYVDGDSLFPLLAAQHLFLTLDDKLPEAVIAGIAYGSFDAPANGREVDFGQDAARFQQFLKGELLPRIESKIRVDPKQRILFGQSLGGGFVLYSAFTDPDLFGTRIASNPSFRLQETVLADEPRAGTRSDLRLYVVSGSANHPPARRRTLEWIKSRSGRPDPWKLQLIDLPGATHSADAGNGYRAALRQLFGWKPAPPE